MIETSRISFQEEIKFLVDVPPAQDKPTYNTLAGRPLRPAFPQHFPQEVKEITSKNGRENEGRKRGKGELNYKKLSENIYSPRFMTTDT
jgi:hypothetical protein